MSTATKEKATPQEAELVRRVMAHSEQTANRSCVRMKLTKVSSEAVTIIAMVTAPDGEQPKKDEVKTKSFRHFSNFDKMPIPQFQKLLT